MAKKRILVVDDEVQLVSMVKLGLERNDYEVITAYDGEEALRKARKEVPDLIVLDLMLPKVDGFMICSLLKKDIRSAAIPIVIFSARSSQEDIELGKKVGADAYIVKPFEPLVLLDKIKELIGA